MKQIVNARQMGWLAVALYLSTGMMSIPQQLTRIARVDAWFTYIFAVIFAMVIVLFLYRLARLFPGKHLFEISTVLAGKWGGGVINAAILIHFWFVFVRNADFFTGFVKTILLPRTPIEILYLLIFIVMIYYGRSSMEVSARVNELVLPGFVVIVVILPLLLSRDLSFKTLEPFLTRPPLQIGIAGAINAAFFGDILIIGAFLHMVRHSKQFYASLRHAVLLSAFLLMWIVITAIAVLGASITGRQAFPIYTLVQQIALGDFLDRVDLVLVSIYFPVYMINLVLVYAAILTGISWFAKSRDHTLYSRPTGLLLLITSFLAFKGMPEVNDFTKYGYPAFVLVEKPLIMAVLFILSLRKKYRDQAENNGNEAANSIPEKEKTSRKSWSFQRWKTLTNYTVAGAALFVVVGIKFGLRLQWVGVLCAAGYSVCILLSVYSSFMETRRAGVTT